jgi:hypothetical protein
MQMSSKLLALRMMAVVGLAAMLVVSLAGCSPTPTVVPTTPPLPTASPQPTVNPQPTYNAIQTQAAQTVIANLTQNAPTAASPVKPTNTVAAATATNTPLPTVAPTATSVPTLPKATATAVVAPAAADGYGCILMGVLPRATDNIVPGGDFDAYWTVLNSGTEMWTPQEVTIRYVGGTNLQKNSNTVELNTVVRPGEKYTLGIDMRAPSNPGVYQSNWSMTHGKVTLCTLNLTIVVRQPSPTPQP